jgi:hypothetical protein
VNQRPMKRMKVEEEMGDHLTLWDALKGRESLPMTDMKGQCSRVPMGLWTMGGACWYEANLTCLLFLFPLEALVGPGTQWNPSKDPGRRCVHFLGKEKRGPREPRPCGAP